MYSTDDTHHSILLIADTYSFGLFFAGLGLISFKLAQKISWLILGARPHVGLIFFAAGLYF